MKMKPYQRKMLKKMLKGAKKGALPFDFGSGLTHTNLGALWAPGMKLNNVTGGGKTVMILDIARDHGMGDVLALRHSAPVRDWSLEPRESAIDAGTRIHTDIAKFMDGIKESGPIYTMPPPGKSLALYAQCIGRVKRIPPEQAEAEFDAKFGGPSLADLIDQGYLQPPPQDVRLAADCLFSKFGFQDGDLLDDLLEDNGYAIDLGEVWGEFGKTELGLSQRLLVKLVDEFLLPSLPIKLEPKICLGIHNPYRCDTAIAHGESTTPRELEVRAVTIPIATVLEMAEAMKLEILGGGK